MVLVVYVAVYVGLSVQGRYVPAIIGTNGVKSYGWAPLGFAAQNGRWIKFPLLFFYPVYLVDAHWWHTSDDNDVMKYPEHHWDFLPGHVQEQQITGCFWVCGHPATNLHTGKTTGILKELELRADHTYRWDWNYPNGFENPSLQTGTWDLQGDQVIFLRDKPYRHYGSYDASGINITSTWFSVTGQFFTVTNQLVFFFPVVPARVYRSYWLEHDMNCYTVRRDYQPKLLKPVTP